MWLWMVNGGEGGMGILDGSRRDGWDRLALVCDLMWELVKGIVTFLLSIS